MNENYHVNLDVFEGPMDLLLFLIRKNHLDVYDIPVAFLLEEYVKYIESLQDLDIDVAAEFLLMAAELAHIKSQMLLPSQKPEDSDEEGDPRAELVRRLIDYQRYKEAAQSLDQKPQLGRDVFSPVTSLGEEESLITAEVDSLWKAFAKLIERLPPETAHQIKVERISVGSRILELLDVLKPGRSISWEELLPAKLTRMNVIVTFLALLEMCKLGLILLHQTDINKIYVIADDNLASADRDALITLDQRAGYGE